LNFFRKLKRDLLYKLKSKIDIDNIDHQEFDSTNLDQLFRFYNTDKGKSFRDLDERIIKGHGYSTYYENHFKKFKNKKINLLEIGVYSGGSSAAFAKYFPDSIIYCFDINIKNFKYKSKKFKVYGIDVSNINMLKEFIKNEGLTSNSDFFNIIIDDGSHKLSDQIKSFAFFFKYLSSNGIYVIEEFNFSDIYEHLNDVPNEKKIYDILNFIKNKKNFKSDIISKEDISYLIDNTKKISTHEGLLKGSNIAFIEKK